MTDKTKVFIDLNKCTEEQRKHIIKITGISEDYIKYSPFVIFDNDRFKTCNSWWAKRMELTELYYPEFIKLFEGGEETEVQKLKKQIDLYKECFELFIPTDKWDEANEFLSD